MKPVNVHQMQKHYINWQGLYNISIDDLMHLTVDIDREVSYDAPVPSQSSEDLSEFLEFFNDPAE